MNRLHELRQWFQSLQQRERRVLAGGGVILLVVIIYGAMVLPFTRSKAALAEHVVEQQKLLAWMQPAAARIRALGGARPAALPADSVLATVNQSAAAAGLGDAVRQVQQQNDGTIRVQLEAAPFDTLLRWLDGLERQYGIRVSDMNVQRGGAAGTVNASLNLRAPAA